MADWLLEHNSFSLLTALMALRNWLSAMTQASADALVAQSLRAKILHDPYYRFQSVQELTIATSLGIKIDVNQASVDDWLRLPGLSIHQARTLVELIQAGVQLHCIEDLAAALSLPVQRLKPLESVLQFCYYAPESVHTLQAVNANTATVEMLQRIPVVDAYLARAIVENRTSGPYRNLIHLQRRLSLSREIVGELMHYLSF